MENVLKIIGELEIIRGVPQLFYSAPIGRVEAGILRLVVAQYQQKHRGVREVDLIVNSPGGDANAAYLSIKTLRNAFERVNVVVPLWAKSAATLMSLGASEIILDEFGEFGPLDAQIAKERDDSPLYEWETALTDESSLDLIESKALFQYFQLYLGIYKDEEIKIDRVELSRQLFRYLAEFYNPLLDKIDPYKMGEKNRTLGIAKSYGEKILRLYTNMNARQRDQLLQHLAYQCPDHGYIIDYHDLKEYDLNVRQASEISAAYEQKLRDLSYAMMTLDMESTIIKFIGDTETGNSQIYSSNLDSTNTYSQAG